MTKPSVNWSTRLAKRTQLMQRSSVREFVRLTRQPGVLSFAGGLPEPALFPVAEMAAAMETVWTHSAASALQYGETEGLAELRDWIAARFSRRGKEVRREQVMITNGAQQALALLGQVLVDPGDRIVVENPTYLALLNAWRPLGAEFAGMPSDGEGLRTELLPQPLEAQVKLAYLIPNFQNPQGTTLSLSRRTALLDWATRQGTIVIEDNPYGELRYDGEPLPHLFDLGLEQATTADANFVVHVGTFSKVLAPGLRLGWVVAPSPLLDKLVQAKQSADLHTSSLDQHLVLALLNRGVLEQQLPRLRAAYRERRDTMLTALNENMPPGTTWTLPAGGMFIMVTLPASFNARALLPEAIARGVAFVPGDEFHLDNAGRNTLRLNFTNATAAQIREGLHRLGDLLRPGPGAAPLRH
jgi:2-aminoadipate transaminase